MFLILVLVRIFGPCKHTGPYIQLCYLSIYISIYLSVGRGHREGDQDVHQRAVGGRAQRQGGTLPLHPRGVHRQVHGNNIRMLPVDPDPVYSIRIQI